MIRIGQRELDVPVWLWAAVPFAFVAYALYDSNRFGLIGIEPDVHYLHIVRLCAAGSIAGFLLMDLMRRSNTPWYGLPFLLMASFAAPAIAIGWLNDAMRQLTGLVVGVAIAVAAGRGGTGGAGLLLMAMAVGIPLIIGALLTLLFTLASRFLAGLPVWSRDTRRELWANLGAALLWLATAFGGYIAIRSWFGLALGYSSEAVPRWQPLAFVTVAAAVTALLATAAHLALAQRARRIEDPYRYGLRTWAVVALSAIALFVSPAVFGRTGVQLTYDYIRPALRAMHLLPSPVISIASYVLDVPFHDFKTRQGTPMLDGKPSYAYAPLPKEYGLTSGNFHPSVFIYRRDITLRETSSFWTDRRKMLEEVQAKEPGKDAAIRFSRRTRSAGAAQRSISRRRFHARRSRRFSSVGCGRTGPATLYPRAPAAGELARSLLTVIARSAAMKQSALLLAETWIASLRSQDGRECGVYPRPTNGILVAITVMNSTLASSGRLAM